MPNDEQAEHYLLIISRYKIVNTSYNSSCLKGKIPEAQQCMISTVQEKYTQANFKLDM